MNTAYIFQLKQPCKNRGITLKNNGDGTVTMDGKKLETISECEGYMASKERTDFGR